MKTRNFKSENSIQPLLEQFKAERNVTWVPDVLFSAGIAICACWFIILLQQY